MSTGLIPALGPDRYAAATLAAAARHEHDHPDDHDHDDELVEPPLLTEADVLDACPDCGHTHRPDPWLCEAAGSLPLGRGHHHG